VMPSVMRTPAAMEKARDIASTCSHIGSDLFEKSFPQGEHQSSGSDADSERSVPPSQRRPKGLIAPIPEWTMSPAPTLGSALMLPLRWNRVFRNLHQWRILRMQ
jgi:hypothetical protein